MSRPLVRVAAGVLCADDGQFLATQRPVGKIAAGKWEFPGGKIEAGETPEQALRRELEEELGIQVQACQPLIRIAHAYTDRDVQMWIYRVTQWSGQPQGHDGQALCWGTVGRLRELDLLGADGPILSALQLPSVLPITPPDADLSDLRQLAARWRERGWALARLRLPDTSASAYAQIASTLITETQVGWILDREPALSLRLGAAGQHLRAADLAAGQRPAGLGGLLCGASVHSSASWRQARQLGCDYALLSPVAPTASHPAQPALGWTEFERIVAQGSLPTYALGGLSPAAVPQAQQAWGQGVSGIRAFG